MCNCSFDDFDKVGIRLYIVPTEADILKFGSNLFKPNSDGSTSFRKGCKVLKAFQQYCVDNEVIINIYQPDLRDYLKSIDWAGYRRELTVCEDGYYLKVQSELLKEDDNPEGFIPMKLSDYYAAIGE